MFTHVTLKNFTVFRDEFTMNPGAGLNIITGNNGTGKTHLIKVLNAYANKGTTGFYSALENEFFPNKYGCLCSLVTKCKGDFNYNIKATNLKGVTCIYNKNAAPNKLEELEDIVFDSSIYAILGKIETIIDGKVHVKDGALYLETINGMIPAELLSDGIYKFMLLYHLIASNNIFPGSVLLWDDVDASIHPKLQGTLAEILLDIQKMGIQIFVTTNSYVFMREVDLSKTDDNDVTYHSLYFNYEYGTVECDTKSDYSMLSINEIEDTYTYLYNRSFMSVLSSNVNDQPVDQFYKDFNQSVD